MCYRHGEEKNEVDRAGAPEAPLVSTPPQSEDGNRRRTRGLIHYLRGLESAPPGTLFRLYLRACKIQAALLVILLLLAVIWGHLPERPLAGSFHSRGLDPEKLDRHRIRLRVDKSARSFQLMSGDTVVRKWFCATGPGTFDGAADPEEPDPIRHFLMMLWLFPGAKQIEGDFRTPEGSYHLASDFRKSKYFRFALISYPDADDRRRSRNPGGAVGIHGFTTAMRPLGRLHALFRWTRGCIALTDGQIEALDPYVIAGTPIEIVP